jgi:hypothetical protein
MVPYTKENIERNKKIIEQNAKLAAELLIPKFQKAVEDINKATKNLASLYGEIKNKKKDINQPIMGGG